MKRLAILITALAAGASLTACAGDPAPAAAPPAPVPMVTVTVGASAVTEAVYTDPAGVDGLNRLQPGSGGVKSAKVTVPKGTVVRISTSGPGTRPACWISDATDQLVFIRGTSTCEATAN